MDPVAELSREVEQTAAELSGNGALAHTRLERPKQAELRRLLEQRRNAPRADPW